jgi:ABC-type Fe3+ transport system substrate-binding protein
MITRGFNVLVCVLWVLLANSAGAADSAGVKSRPSTTGIDGFMRMASHGELVDAAKKEPKLHIIRSLSAETFNHMMSAFKQKYPFVTEISAYEFKGTEGPQRFILELQAGRGREWDVFDVAPEQHSEFAPFLKKFDILNMAKSGVLAIPPQMIDPKGRNVVSITAGVHVVGYNRKAISEERVPNSWDDFLKPEFKGKKFLVDIRPQGFAALAPRMGEEWMINYARRIKEQDPVWTRGTQALVRMSTGEETMYHLAYYHSCMLRSKEKQQKVLENSLGCKVIEPIPIRIGDRTAVSLFSRSAHTALLWVEFQASPEAQKIIDAHEPLKSSLYVPGSEINKLVKGKQTSVNDWQTFENTERWMELTVKALGFPQAGTRAP